MPKNGTRNRDQNVTQIRTPKCNPGLQICTETQTRTCRDDLHSAVGLAAWRSYSIVQQTNNFNQRRKGNLGGQNFSSREHEYLGILGCSCERHRSSTTAPFILCGSRAPSTEETTASLDNDGNACGSTCRREGGGDSQPSHQDD